MKFSIFKTAKAQQGQLCTAELFDEATNSPSIIKLCNAIADEKDPNRRAELKKQLPVVTWQASFPSRRVNAEAQPSGLFMLDVDHVDNPFKLWNDRFIAHRSDWGIHFAGMTASRHGLRIVARCRPEFKTIAECQQWLATLAGIPFDAACKDWARCSFLVHSSYTYFCDYGNLFNADPDPATIYNVTTPPTPLHPTPLHPTPLHPTPQNPPQSHFQGIPLADICRRYLIDNGGEPAIGERNSKLFKLATRIRYICDFNPETLLAVLPNYGLSDSEMRQIVANAIAANRASSIPHDLLLSIENLRRFGSLSDDIDDVDDSLILASDTSSIPPLPPVFKEWFEIAPNDFKRATIICNLPILGTLASRLRAVYLDGLLHSPSFQVSLEAPQASGKSFVRRMVDYELAALKQHDEQQREIEREYENKVRQFRLLNQKADKKDQEALQRPETMIRIVPATMSITKMLIRMSAAKGLHLFACEEEIDTVLKAFKRGICSYSDALRSAFDNSDYGQDYASENSFSGMVPLFYNVIFCGTPKAMCRFYPDVEDGLVSRVTFVTLPDQFGKKIPTWTSFSPHQKAVVDIALERLSQISIVGEDVQPPHVMNMDFLNQRLDQWISVQQAVALKINDRTRDTFCRRAAVVGFRAGMLAWFLYGEDNDPLVKDNVASFAIWIANMMLNQHILRFNVENTSNNTIFAEKVFNSLPAQFCKDQLQKLLIANGYQTRVREVIYKWKLAHLIQSLPQNEPSTAPTQNSTFRKTST